MRSTVIVPLAVVELEQGQTVAEGTAVDLPEAYGEHLVAELLAIRGGDTPEEPEEGDEGDEGGEGAGEGAGAPANGGGEASESMTRDELDQMATEAGLEPADYRTKADIVEAINAS